MNSAAALFSDVAVPAGSPFAWYCCSSLPPVPTSSEVCQPVAALALAPVGEKLAATFALAASLSFLFASSHGVAADAWMRVQMHLHGSSVCLAVFQPAGHAMPLHVSPQPAAAALASSSATRFTSFGLTPGGVMAASTGSTHLKSTKNNKRYRSVRPWSSPTPLTIDTYAELDAGVRAEGRVTEAGGAALVDLAVALRGMFD
eukprot:CAMPEP_0115871364 /NCGR_PEP_ID=MMETSP0287-20121206/22829_1 /TAXON_ID=412157 /ORGANISM="Chrysochromulina rotalis, Strain UIO044" /LENGTH=201 /DNA_ID=CAMNT_0003326165 /DNA_START=19 /DNA_END=623 /DNA_ORIENTATION=+